MFVRNVKENQHVLGKMENTQSVDGVGMVLKRIEIEEKTYRPIPNDDGTANTEMMGKMKYPEGVIDLYEHMNKEKFKECGEEMGIWYRQGIDEAINVFLKENGVTKDGLHSIETKASAMWGMPQRAIIIYEEHINEVRMSSTEEGRKELAKYDVTT